MASQKRRLKTCDGMQPGVRIVKFIKAIGMAIAVIIEGAITASVVVALVIVVIAVLNE